MLEPQEEYRLAKRWHELGDTDAAHRLVTSHLRLMASIAMGYREKVEEAVRHRFAAIDCPETRVAR